MLPEQKTVRWTPAWNHVQELVEVGKYSEKIDCRIASLIRLLWQAGFDTTSSCEDFPAFPEDTQRVWISFPESFEATRFLRALCLAENPLDDVLCQKIANSTVNPLDELFSVEMRRECWYFRAAQALPFSWLKDRVEDVKRHEASTSRGLRLEIEVSFPFSDMPEIQKRLMSFVASQSAKDKKS